ncbi:ImmA/IrrE family metallo-endopeptidase [Staphylococcus equorum]|uniref:ImmA/IrrE family metallo-endopeptidase n=1 Tax=Staphylococcus equorum TaxID=246432 RepID=UPI003CF4E51F
MNRYERLMSNNQHLGIYDNYSLDGDFHGVYADGIVAIDKNLTSNSKLEVLCEEIAHSRITYGNILNQEDLFFRKFEIKARRLGNELAMSLSDIIDAFKNGVKNIFEMANFLEVSEKHVNECLTHYKQKYGLSKKYGEFLIQFEPLRVFEYHEIKLKGN